MKFRLSQILFLAMVTPFLAVTPGFSQAILEEREWTNPDGKKIRAELLDFEDEFVRLRLKAGNTFKVKPESFSRLDQAVILKERFKREFRHTYSESMGAHFFYSKQVGKGENNKTVAYIGNDYKSAWLRIKVSAHAGLIEDGVKVVFLGENTGHLRINYGPDDTERIRSNSVIDLSLTDHSETISSLFANPEKTKIYIETGAGAFTEVKLSKAERLGLRKVSGAFQSLFQLTTDHVWWTTFQGLDPLEFEKLVAEKKVDEMTRGQAMDRGPILPPQEWSREDSGETFHAEVIGFDRHKAVFQLGDESVQSIPVADLSPDGRKRLVSARTDRSIYEGWHPYDDGHSWFWPKKWTNPEERIEKQVILFVINRETGEPGLYLQLHLDAAIPERIAHCKLQSRKILLDLEFPAGDEVMKLRGTKGTKVWLPLRDEPTNLLLVAAPGMEGLEYEITPASGPVQRGAFSAEEYAASIEALEICRISQSLYEKKPLNDMPESGN